MNVEDLKKSNYIIFEAIAGSQAYGTATPQSDMDIRGVYRIPKNQRLSLLDIPKEISNDSQDIKYYELEKFIKLAADCNPSIIELMWLPDDCIKIQTSLMDKLIENRNLFISKKAYHTFNGYAYSMLHKAKSQNRFVNNPKPKERPVHEDFCFIIPINDRRLASDNGFCLDFTYSGTQLEQQMKNTPMRPIPIKETGVNLSNYHCARLEQTEHVYRLYYYGKEAKGVFRGDNMLTPESIPLKDESERFVGFLIYNKDLYEKEVRDWISYWDWKNNRSESRWQDQENGLFQYDRKNASHCVRLIYSGKNILINNEPIVRFTGNDLQYLKDIREGKISYEILMESIELQMKNLEEAYNKSTLIWGVDIHKINILYQELLNM